MLAFSSILGVVVGTTVVPLLVRRLGWYGTLRTTSAAHVALFPLIGLAGMIANLEGGVGKRTSVVLGLVLVAYEIGETSFT
jgi:hypothetical protein